MQQRHCLPYQRFRLWLEHATNIDMARYAEWVRDHQVELSVNFVKSEEDDAAVWGRMQYSRSVLGIGL